MRVLLNGATVLAETEGPSYYALQIQTQFDLVVGDYIEIQVYASTAQTLTPIAAQPAAAWIGRIGDAAFGGPIKFAEVGPLAAPQPTATLPVSGSLPQNYRHARIKWQARCDNASAQTVGVQFNGDTGANYEFGLVETSGTIQASGTGQTSVRVGIVPGTGAAAGRVSGGFIDIENYSDTTFFTTLNAMCQRGDSLVGEYDSGNWLSTAAVTSITIMLSAGNFIAGSVFTLYLEP